MASFDIGALIQKLNGIKFPAVQVPSADQNTLDDYEEGAWTGTLTPATSGSITMNSGSAGNYIKIGRLVMVNGIFQTLSVSSPVGILKLTGLPFPCASVCAVAIQADGLSASLNAPIMALILGGLSEIDIYKFVNGTITAIAGDVIANSVFRISAAYVATS
jgi:hypothetical protein